MQRNRERGSQKKYASIYLPTVKVVLQPMWAIYVAASGTVMTTFKRRLQWVKRYQLQGLNVVVLCFSVQEHMDDLCVKTYEFQRVEK